MPAIGIAEILQLIIAVGLLNVWLVRAHSSTSYRGGEALTLKEEFAAYGLPGWAFYAVGALKMGSAALLIVGLWIPALVQPAAGVVAILMLGAVAMHVKVKDPIMKSLPASLILLMSVGVLFLA